MRSIIFTRKKDRVEELIDNKRDKIRKIGGKRDTEKTDHLIAPYILLSVFLVHYYHVLQINIV